MIPIKNNFVERIKGAWNVFKNKSDIDKYNERTSSGQTYLGLSSTVPLDKSYSYHGPDRSIMSAIYNKIAVDVASLEFRHVRLGDNNKYLEDISSSLNECFTVAPNLDQTPIMFFIDLVYSMLDEGVVAVVPTDSDTDQMANDGQYLIYALRVAKIVEWYPQHVKVNLYDERDGHKKDITLPKEMVAIVENPFYTTMNSPSSTYRRLIRKLNLMDRADENAANGPFNAILKLPFAIRSERQHQEAEARRESLQRQLTDRNNQYGIATIDSQENFIPLNRSFENNTMSSIKYLTSMLYSQLGITEEIMAGTANEDQMVNYYARSIEPIATAIVSSFRRTFLTKTARTQKQDIQFFRNPFKLVSAPRLADIGDRLTRNEILSSNEMRAIIGFKPVQDPRADELRNKNIASYPYFDPATIGGMPMQEVINDPGYYVDENGQLQYDPSAGGEPIEETYQEPAEQPIDEQLEE